MANVIHAEHLPHFEAAAELMAAHPAFAGLPTGWFRKLAALALKYGPVVFSIVQQAVASGLTGPALWAKIIELIGKAFPNNPPVSADWII